jgi:ech hydrogenase subunit D
MTDGEIRSVTAETLLTEVQRLKEAGWRLMQICARSVKDTGNEITYSFGDDMVMAHLRLTAPYDSKVPSISHIYSSAFLYENEMHDLFGVEVEMMTLDYHGHFYKIGKETPFKK